MRPVGRFSDEYGGGDVKSFSEPFGLFLADVAATGENVGDPATSTENRRQSDCLQAIRLHQIFQSAQGRALRQMVFRLLELFDQADEKFQKCVFLTASSTVAFFMRDSTTASAASFSASVSITLGANRARRGP